MPFKQYLSILYARISVHLGARHFLADLGRGPEVQWTHQHQTKNIYSILLTECTDPIPARR